MVESAEGLPVGDTALSHPVRDAALGRRSHPAVTADAPSHDEVVALVSAAASVADYGAARPWRIVELRGKARERLGSAFVEASGGGSGASSGSGSGSGSGSQVSQFDSDTAASAAKLAGKPLRAELLLALVVSPKSGGKASVWEQEAAASGVAHLLSLLLHEAGWGVMWRSGPFTRTAPVERMHALEPHEYLLGWLYVGGIPLGARLGAKNSFDASAVVSAL